MKSHRLPLAIAITIACSLILTTTVHTSGTRIYLPHITSKHTIPTATTQPTATTTPTPSPCSCAGNLYNCSDFNTHAAAQACYEHCLTITGRDIHRLDTDKDGIACESLP